MKVIHIQFDKIPDLQPSAAAVGYFDGFHTGHMKLIEKTLSLAKEHHVQSAVLTFDPDPWVIFKPYGNRDHLVSLHDKAIMAAAMGMDYLYVVEFSKEFSQLSIEQFHEFLVKMKVQYLVCGFDFSYACKGYGNVETLRQQKAIEVFVIDAVQSHKQKISSTRIEQLVRAGLVYQAAELLGIYYSIPGVIVHGYKRGGKELGFPTANLQPEKGYVMPANGVYAGYVFCDGAFYPAMMNVGSNPTFQNHEMTIEAHILDFDRNIYGKMVRFFFTHRIRPEVRFESAEALKKQLVFDRTRTIQLLDEKENLFKRTAELWSLEKSFDILD